jgi:hypothetical protein
MTITQALAAWLQAFTLWAAVAAFFGAVVGVGILAARAVLALLGGA